MLSTTNEDPQPVPMFASSPVIFSPLRLDISLRPTAQRKQKKTSDNQQSTKSFGINVEKIKVTQPAELSFEEPVIKQYLIEEDARNNLEEATVSTGCYDNINDESLEQTLNKNDDSTSSALISKLPIPINTMERLSIRERINRVTALQTTNSDVAGCKSRPKPGKLKLPTASASSPMKTERGSSSTPVANKEIKKINKVAHDKNDVNNNTNKKKKDVSKLGNSGISVQQPKKSESNVIRAQSTISSKSPNLTREENGDKKLNQQTTKETHLKRASGKPPKVLPKQRTTSKIIKTVGKATGDNNAAIEVTCTATTESGKGSEIMEVQSLPLTTAPQIMSSTGAYDSIDGAVLSTMSATVPVVVPALMKPERIMRDFRLSNNEMLALKTILKKIDLYDSDVRDTLFPLLKGNYSSTASTNDAAIDDESLPDIVLRDAARDSLKEKLYLSRRELDSYISFCKKMEKQKRQTVSEKEELATKLQWHERRLTRMENENRSLKVERTELLNQVYELRCPASVPINERSGSVCGSGSNVKQSGSERGTPEQHPPSSLWLEVSKQRLMYEADAFAQERGKLIKERQRLDEEVRKVQIRCVSLLAQLQHGEKTIDKLQREKEGMKDKIAKLSKLLLEDNKKILERVNDLESSLRTASKSDIMNKKFENKIQNLIDVLRENEIDKQRMKERTETMDTEIERLGQEQLQLEEDKLSVDNEAMTLRESLAGLQAVNDENEKRFEELNEKFKEQMNEVSNLTDSSNNHVIERMRLVNKVEELTTRLAESQKNEFAGDDDRRTFRNFLEMLSLKLEENLGENHVTRDTDGTTLKEQADILGKQITAHLSPSQRSSSQSGESDYADIKEERDELLEEVTALKYAMSCRIEIATTRQPVAEEKTCNCSREKDKMIKEMKEMKQKTEQLDDEVARLHDDKQSLLMSFLNLQAASRSRESSRVEPSQTDDEEYEEADDEETNDELEDDDDDASSVEGLVDEGGLQMKKQESNHIIVTDATTKDGLNNSSSTVVEAVGTSNEKQDCLSAAVKSKQRRSSGRFGSSEMLNRLRDEDRLEIERLKGEINALHKLMEFHTESVCPHCNAAGIEAKHYLNIIEELTEDKLSLEKVVTDASSVKEKTQLDLEHVSEDKYYLQCELENLAAEKDEITQRARDEIEYILQTLENVEQENITLEDHLKKQRQDKLELLDRLKEAEEDRLGLIKTLKVMGESKSDHSESESDDHRRLMKSVDSFDDTSDSHSKGCSADNKDLPAQDLSDLIIDLKARIDSHEVAYEELEKAMDARTNLFNDERFAKERLLEEKERLEIQVKALQTQLLANTSLDLDKTTPVPLHRSASDGLMRNSPLMMRRRTSPLCDVPEKKSPSKESIPTMEQRDQPRTRRSQSLDQEAGKKHDRLSKAKTLCFQISFNSDAM